MAQFLLKFKLGARPNRDRPDQAVDRGRIVLGSRPLADVYVKDRLVPQEAVAFHFDGRRLELEVLGRLAGVFVDGYPTEGRGAVRDGAFVQVGHSAVEVRLEPEAQRCVLTVTEGHLGAAVDAVVKKAAPERPFRLVASGPQEHLWGRSPVLRRANWAAAAVGALLLLSFPFLRNTDAMTRGPLLEPHRIGAEGGPAECAACHAPFSSDYGPSCSVEACHPAYDSAAFHPYERVGEIGCAWCHAEHVGADADVIPSLERTGSGWPETCLACHAGDDFAQKSASAAAAALAGGMEGRIRDRPATPVRRPLEVDGFSHADHRVPKERRLSGVPAATPPEGQVPIGCNECHVRSVKRAGSRSNPEAEYALVSYERCLECHADWRVDVHGRDENGVHCNQCHARAPDPTKITADLRRVTVPASGSLYVVPARRHSLEQEECARCHVDPQARVRAPAGQAEVTLAFRHDHHLPTVEPGRGTELGYSQACTACHAEVAGSRSLEALGGELGVVDLAACDACHTDGRPQPVPAEGTREVVDIFHQLHTVGVGDAPRGALRSLADRGTLAKGCLACHVPGAGAERMGFREGVLDCTSCHAGHENLGEGKCVLCHVDRADPRNRDARGELLYRVQEPGIYDRAKAVVKETAVVRGFDHFSPGHDGHDCAGCHGTDSVDSAERVLTVPWPRHDAPECVGCHVKERYHR